MKILMITDFYWPFVGGVEQHVRRLSHALAARGHEVAVATLGNGQLEDFTLDGRVRVYRLRSTTQRAPWLFKNAGRPWAPPFPDLEVTGGLRKILEKEKPDIVHGHDWLARSFLPLKKRSGVKFVMSLHYYTLSCAKKSLMVRNSPCSGPGLAKCLACSAQHYGVLKGIPVNLTNRILGGAEKSAVDLFLAVSSATAAGNGLAHGDRYRVIPNFMPDGNRVLKDIDQYLNLLPKEPYLLFVGDLRREKGLDVLLSAYRDLSGSPPLVLIGKVWEDTPKEFPPNVMVLKDWPNEAVLNAWKRSMIGIVPSLWPEPFGSVVIEAMSSGHPVIASSVGGIPEIVSDGIDGILVPPGDAQALKQAIERLLADAALRETLGQAASHRAEFYQAAAVVPQIEQAYQEVLQMNGIV